MMEDRIIIKRSYPKDDMRGPELTYINTRRIAEVKILLDTDSCNDYLGKGYMVGLEITMIEDDDFVAAYSEIDNYLEVIEQLGLTKSDLNAAMKKAREYVKTELDDDADYKTIDFGHGYKP